MAFSVHHRVQEVFTGMGSEQEKFLQQELLTAGLAYVYPRYVDGCWNGGAMKQAEAIAQTQHQGVWAGNYQRPWKFRRQQH